MIIQMSKSKVINQKHENLSRSREEERREISHLNDRLASYIDYARSLEQSKKQLTNKIHQLNSSSISIDEGPIRQSFEKEINALKRAVDEANKARNHSEKATKQADADLNETQRLRQSQIAKLADLESQLSLLQNEFKSESVSGAKLKNRVQTLKDVLKFEARVSKEETNQLRSTSICHEETDQQLTGKALLDYDSALVEDMRQFHAQTLQEMEAYREELQISFRTQIQALEEAGGAARRQVGDLRVQLQRTQAENDRLQSELDSLGSVLRGLETDLSQQAEAYQNEARLQTARQRSLHQQLEETAHQFADLMAVKIALDQEILTYRKLLQTEHERLRIKPSLGESSFSSIGGAGLNVGGSKRARLSSLGGDSTSRYEINATGSGPISFSDLDTNNGHFVEIKATDGTKEINLAGWIMKYTADEHQGSYKFPKTAIIKPNQTIRIWSHESGRTSSPPGDLVMRSNLQIYRAKKVEIVLLDTEETECCRVTLVTGRAHTRARSASSSLADDSTNNERCSLM